MAQVTPSKTLLITGVSRGFGFELAAEAVAQGHQVLGIVRSEQSRLAVLAQLPTVQLLVADITAPAYESLLTQFVAGKTIDVLINNAGIYNSKESRNKDGIDIRFVVNYLTPYFLTQVLIPLLNNAENARIINLGSAAQSSLVYPSLLGKEEKSQGETYAQSKLALIMWSFDLAKTLQKISVMAVNPGSLLNTKMANEAFGTNWAPAEKGADLLYELAISDKYQGVTGKYYDNDKSDFGNAHPDAYNEIAIAKLLKITKELLN